MEIIDETGLQDFRRRHLSPDAVLDTIERHVQVLLRVSLGVGKSFAADALLRSPRLWKRFNLVIYCAPTWAILNERPFVNGAEAPPVPHLVIRPRPTEACGPFDEPWRELQERKCSAYGKATLCRDCQDGVPPADRCFWPGQLRKIKGTKLVFAPEQQLVNNPSLVALLQQRTQHQRILVILDEARLLDTSFEVTIRRSDLEVFADVILSLERPKKMSASVLATWRRTLKRLLGCRSTAALEGTIQLPGDLHYHAYHVQEQGILAHGDAFRFLGYDLSLLSFSRSHERHLDHDGTIRFIARPYLHCHLLLLSAHINAAYAGHRLGRDPLPSPFEKTVFRHSGTRIVNIRNRIGADRYFGKNHPQILDTFAVLILRNIIEGRSTLLISRQKRKDLCAEYLTKRLAGWGCPVQIAVDGYEDLPETPNPKIIPLIHYGMLGVNDFREYEAALGLNSYYVPSTELNRALQEAEPEYFRHEVQIVSGPEMRRHVEIVDREPEVLSRTQLADFYLRKLEVDPALQVAGRVRFPVLPRLVVFSQMHDLSPDVGPVEEVRSLVGLREALGIPSAREIDTHLEERRIQDLASQGHTQEEIAVRLGVSARTIRRRLGSGKAAKNPTEKNSSFCRTFGRFLPTWPTPGEEQP